MPLNYQHILAQTDTFCSRAIQHRQLLDNAMGALMEALAHYATRLPELRHLVEVEAQTNQSMRCATPLQEQISNSYHLPENTETFMLIAADGSQINPSRHRQVDFGLINVATICIQPGTDIPPAIESESKLLDVFEQRNNHAYLTEDSIALERDLLERAALLQRARSFKTPLITLTDGPLELFRETGETGWFEKKMTEYIQILEECRSATVATAGYVDKPHSDLVNRMLRVALEKIPIPGFRLSAEDLDFHVPDACLFSSLLSVPGDRSAIFAIHSQWARHFKAELQLCFFYLNVGRQNKPSLARVEIPIWVAGDLEILNALHVAIYHQCEIMGSRPYPYILHRAHELALVTYEEASQLENMLAGELRSRGMDAGERSNKQSAKELPGRGRYQ